jgi:uncharacterized spore protein YtfJ
MTDEMQNYDEAPNRIENLMSQFLAAADVQAVYGEPVEQGEYLIIPAAEILAVTGFGMGLGYGQGPKEGDVQQTGAGSGGGGGGRVLSRPVAVVVAGPAGVEVKPVVDITKIGLAALTAFGFIIAASSRMRRGKIKFD